MPDLSTILTVYWVGGLIAIFAFLGFVVLDRYVASTPWNTYTIMTRIPMILIWWPLFLFLFCGLIISIGVKAIIPNRKG